MASEDLKKPEEEGLVQELEPEAVGEEAAAEENEDPEAKEEQRGEEVEEVEEGGSGKKRGRKGRRKEVSRLKDDEKELVRGSSERPTRERKVVERYSSPAAGRPTASKVLSIEKGSGTQLKDIPNVAFKLSKRKADDNLQVLHTILFGKKAKVHSLKRNIGQFSGFVWVENEEKQKGRVREKLDKCVKEKLVDFCDVLNIQINKTTLKKEEISAKLLEFLESPYATTDILLADKEQKTKKRRRSASGKNVILGEGQKTNQMSEIEDAIDDIIKTMDAKDDSHEDSDKESLQEESDHPESKSVEEDKEEDEPKEEMPSPKSSSRKIQKETLGDKSKDKPKVVKKVSPEKSLTTPTKSTKKSSSSTSKKDVAHPDAASGSLSKSKGSVSKKQKIEKEIPKSPIKDKNPGKKQSSKSSSKNSVNVQGKGKNSKSKPEPTREEMLAVVVGILKEVDFNTATLSDILKQLGTHFGVDLMHRKAEVKDIITEVINNMSDEDEEGDDDNEAGDEKDEDGDDDDDDDA